MFDSDLLAARHVAMEKTFSRRQFLTYLLVMDGIPLDQATERVQEVAASRPGLDMDELMTWAQWQELATTPVASTAASRSGHSVKKTAKHPRHPMKG